MAAAGGPAGSWSCRIFCQYVAPPEESSHMPALFLRPYTQQEMHKDVYQWYKTIAFMSAQYNEQRNGITHEETRQKSGTSGLWGLGKDHECKPHRCKTYKFHPIWSSVHLLWTIFVGPPRHCMENQLFWETKFGAGVCTFSLEGKLSCKV